MFEIFQFRALGEGAHEEPAPSDEQLCGGHSSRAWRHVLLLRKTWRSEDRRMGALFALLLR